MQSCQRRKNRVGAHPLITANTFQNRYNMEHNPPEIVNRLWMSLPRTFALNFQCIDAFFLRYLFATQK